VLVAGESAHTLARVVEWGDGWFPRGRPGVGAILAGLEDLRALAAAAGRDMTTLSVSVFGVPADRDTLERYRAAGVTRVLLRLPSEGRDAILPLLDRYATLAR
jgi:alkanesulfonate monooxygenase SsuD/methylene tetrahydromethanopterin reductase-like flavin-dependent oxidoreductase (luciferase family)